MTHTLVEFIAMSREAKQCFISIFADAVVNTRVPAEFADELQKKLEKEYGLTFQD